MSTDADQLAKVQADVTVDGSLAQAYAAYDGEFAAAASAVGQTGEPADVEEVDGGFKACIGDSSDQCATWTDLEGQDGKLTDFDMNGIELSDLLVDLTGQPPIESAGLYKVQPDYAYRQPKSGKLYVLCTVTAGRPALAQAGHLHRAGPDPRRGRGPEPGGRRRRHQQPRDPGLRGRAGREAGRAGHLRPQARRRGPPSRSASGWPRRLRPSPAAARHHRSRVRMSGWRAFV